MQNIAGVFYIDLFGKKKTLKATVGLTQRLEMEIYKRPLLRVLKESLPPFSEPYVSDVYSLFHEAMIEGGDTRYSFEQVGEEILKKGGAPAVLGLYQEILGYMLTAGIIVEVDQDKKK